MTVNDLRALVDNLDEYIHIPGGIERLKKTVLHLAVSGQLVPQIASEGTGEELYKQIQAKYANKKSLPGITTDDKFSSTPGSWLWVRLGNVSDSNIGLTYSPSDVDSRGTAVLRSNNIQDGKMNYDDLVYVSSNIPESKKAHIGDLLICARNGSRRLVGKNAIVNQEGMCFGAFMALLRSHFTPFIKLFLDSPEFRRNLDGVQTTTINQITQGLLNNIALPLPPLAEQQRIVEKVDEIFTFIDELDAKYKAEEAERSKLVRSSLRALSHKGSTLALENLTSIIKTKADAAELRKSILHLAISGGLSSSWESFQDKILNDLIDLKTGRLDANAAVDDGQYPFFTCSRNVSRIDKYAYDTECVLLAGNGDFNVKYYSGRFEAYQRTYILESKDNNVLDVPYLFLVMQVRRVELLGEAMGSAMPYIRKGNVLSTKIKLPSIDEQKRIFAKTTELLNLVTNLEKHLEK